MFTNTYLPHVGGVANSVETFRVDLEALGHRVLVVAPEFSASPLHDPREEAHVLRLPAIQNFNGSDFSLRIPLPFLIDQSIEKFQPDIIHSHHPYLLGDAALRAAKKRRLPLIFTHHTRYEQYTHYVTSDSHLLKQFVIHLSTEYANVCERVIAPSASVTEMIRARGVSRPVFTIPTGVDVETFGHGDGAAFRKKYGIPEGAQVIGHVGRLAPEKNIAYLGRAAAEVMQRDTGIYFLCVGSGAALAELEHYFDKHTLKPRAVMTGNQTGADLVDAYHAMDVFAFSSQSETQGMVLTEAMAAGKPVVALDAPGVREVVRDNENGRLLPSSAPTNRFSKALETCFRQPHILQSWSRNAFKTAREFDRGKCAEKLVHVYQEAITQRASDTSATTLGERNALDEIVQRIKAEWALASEKMTALLNAVKE